MMPQAELDAADRALCEWEDARRQPCITASAWGLSNLLRVPRGGMPRIPIPNPNAGLEPAYPKGRWS